MCKECQNGKNGAYFVTLPNDIEKDCVSILILASLPVMGEAYTLKKYDKNVMDWEGFKLSFSAGYGYYIICDENLENLQRYLFKEKDRILSDFRKYGKAPEFYATKFDIVDMNEMKAVCRIDLDHNQIISLKTINDNTYQIPPFSEVKVKTKYLKELAVHLIQIINGYDSEYAIPVDLAYMLYEIIKEDNSTSRKE